MNTDHYKAQATALAKALKALGIAEIPAARALDVIARMNGKSSWQAARVAGHVGRWNALQAAVYRAYPHADLLPIDEGDDYADCGDTLFVAVMELARSQPITRVLKTLTHWAAVADQLLLSVCSAIEASEPFSLSRLAVPKGLPELYARFLAVELREDVDSWEDAGQRLERVRSDLYRVIDSAACLSQGHQRDVMLLQSEVGADPLPVLVPEGMSVKEAQACAAEVIAELKVRDDLGGRAHDGFFDYDASELLVRLVAKGFGTFPAYFSGPVWD